MNWLGKLPHPRKILVAGNHDASFEKERAKARALVPPGVTYLEDSGTVIDGVHFYGSPWTPAFMDLAFNARPGEQLASIWARVPRDVDILVSHGPPYGHGDFSAMTGEHVGCRDLLARIRELEPPLLLFGHIHEGGGVTYEGRTACVNATTWECQRPPTVLTYDPATRKVVLEMVPRRSPSEVGTRR